MITLHILGLFIQWKKICMGDSHVQGTSGLRTRINRMKRLRKKKSQQLKICGTPPLSKNNESVDKPGNSSKSGQSCTVRMTYEDIQSSQSSIIHHSVPDEGLESSLIRAEALLNVLSTGKPMHSNATANRPSGPPVGESSKGPLQGHASFGSGVVSVDSPVKAFIHGNYHRYYGYRLGNNLGEDPRVALLEKRWFHKKRCLDIGCNEGIVTLDIVMKFGTASMTGIDVDEHLIKRACSHLREQRSSSINDFVTSQQTGIDSSDRKNAKSKMQSLAQTWFVHGNILASNIDKGSFDCITAFSVIKWIHLHGGDDAVRYLFSIVYDLLAPGGRFILEPQPWKSYKAASQKMKKHKMNDALKETYFFRLHDITIRPKDFCKILPEQFGLTFVREICPPVEATAGFSRTLYIFQKLH